MARPPKTTPHSDIDGVHQDERPSVEVAEELGQSAEEVAKARRKSKGRPHPPGEGSRRDEQK